MKKLFFTLLVSVIIFAGFAQQTKVHKRTFHNILPIPVFTDTLKTVTLNYAINVVDSSVRVSIILKGKTQTVNKTINYGYIDFDSFSSLEDTINAKIQADLKITFLN